MSDSEISRPFTALLSPAVGYGVVVGIGGFFALLMSECWTEV